MVNVSSMCARPQATGQVGYGAAKAALNAFGKALSEEFGPQGVRVNTASPGPTRTGIWEDMDGDYIVEGGGIKTARARPTVDVSPVQRPYEGPSTG